MSPLKLLLLAILAYTLSWFVGCQSEQKSEVHNSNQIEEAEIFDTTEILRIEENEDRLFSALNHLHVTDEEHLLFVDAGQQFIYYFDMEGNMLQKFGGEGSGPGEFERIGEVVLRNDELLVYDLNQMRATIFARDEHVNWAFKEDQSGMNISLGRFNTLWQRLHGGNVLYYERTTMDSPPASAEILESNIQYHIADSDFNQIQNEVLTRKSSGAIIRPFDGGGIQVFEYEYGQNEVLEVCPKGYIYTGHNDELTIYRIDSNLDTLTVFNAPRDPLPLSQKTKDDLSGGDSEIKSLLPDYKPVFRELFISDHNDVWVEIFTSEDEPNWIIFDEKGQLSGRFSLDEKYTVHSIRGNQLYTISEDEDGLPTVSVLEVDRNTSL